MDSTRDLDTTRDFNRNQPCVGSSVPFRKRNTALQCWVLGLSDSPKKITNDPEMNEDQVAENDRHKKIAPLLLTVTLQSFLLPFHHSLAG